MPTTASYSGSIAATSAGSYQGNNVAGTITATVDDGVISVGDEVTLSGFASSTKTLGGVGDNTAFYLGQGTFGGKIGYVFGDLNTIAGNTAYLVVFDEFLSGPAEAADVLTFANTKHALGSDPACFAAGTMIATPFGETAVESLSIGDLVRTVDGRAVPVKWVGQQTIVKMFAGPGGQMVCIKAGALGNHSDLTVTADHGMVVDGYVINASALVNDGSINWVPLADTADRFTVYHVETEAHDVILANGAASETYLDMPGRMAFDNYEQYLDLYGTERLIPEMPTPRISSQRLLPGAIKAQLGIGEVTVGPVNWSKSA